MRNREYASSPEHASPRQREFFVNAITEATLALGRHSATFSLGEELVTLLHESEEYKARLGLSGGAHWQMTIETLEGYRAEKYERTGVNSNLRTYRYSLDNPEVIEVIWGRRCKSVKVSTGEVYIDAVARVEVPIEERVCSAEVFETTLHPLLQAVLTMPPIHERSVLP